MGSGGPARPLQWTVTAARSAGQVLRSRAEAPRSAPVQDVEPPWSRDLLDG